MPNFIGSLRFVRRTAVPDLSLELQCARNYVHARYGPPDPQWRAEARDNDLFDNAFTDANKHAEEHLALVFVKSKDPDDTRKYDFTHESTHLLNPVPCNEVSYLEEGAATVISMERQDYINPTTFLELKRAEMRQTRNARYLEAYNDLMCLIKKYPGGLIKGLRGPKKCSLSTDIKPIDIIRLIPGSDAIAQRLCRKFYKS